MVKFSLIKTILILIICINFLTANRYVEAFRDIEYGLKFDEEDNRSLDQNIEEKTTRRSSSSFYGMKSKLQDYYTALDDVELIPLTDTDLSSSSSSSSLIDERSNRSLNLTYENLREAKVLRNLKKLEDKRLSSEFESKNLTDNKKVSSVTSDEVIDQSKRGRFTLADIKGPSILQDVESLGDESLIDSVHVRVKRDDNLVRDEDEIFEDGREIFSLKKDSLNDLETLPRRSAALLIRRKRSENFPSRKYSEAELKIPRKMRKVSERIGRGGRKKNRGKYRKHKHRKKPKNGRHHKKMTKLSTRNDFNARKNLKHWREPSGIVRGQPEVEKRDFGKSKSKIVEVRKREEENIVRVKRNQEVLEKRSRDTKVSNNRGGKFCQKEGIKADELKYYDDVRETNRVQRRKRLNRGRKSFNPRGKIGKKYLAKKSVEEMKNLLGQLTSKVNELREFYVGENKGDREEEQRFKRGKKPATRCLDGDLKNLTKPGDTGRKRNCLDKTVGFKSKLETEMSSGVVEETSKTREERKISNDEKKSENESSDENKRRKRKPRRKWDRWTDWSSCSVTCGKGRQIRWRHCVHDCTLAETEMEEKTCQLPACGPGKFLGIF